MRKLVLGLLGAAALVTSTAGTAAVTVTGSSMSWTGPTTTGANTNIGYSDTGLANPFTEWLTFTNDVAGYYNITATTAASSVNFTSIVLTGPGGPYDLVKQFDNGIGEHWGFAELLTLGVGTYTLTLNGTNSQTGGLGGDIDITAVPEPATWGMMLLGFGAAGYAMRRRRRPALLQVA